MSPTQNFPSMGGKRLCHHPHKISPPWEESNVILCNYILHRCIHCRDWVTFHIKEPMNCVMIMVKIGVL